ncbi:helix-turn-helix transcriptional regulator [Luteimonas wenzhouensis]|jgi:putative transcriptional regulator|uniref:Helix-turn-helix transcriptional regulator n=1 Tax=Luteimonas wenzhouensis TaxID=2599615 RepID=A0A5C5U9D1_9GAMM|nr:helix-turn-helix transcriptional regulator [Xanthomonadaceae bacterium]TWT22152.1 helix-turn-helix transcriptional regulator [Luteimonas wenzhouensis]
MKSSGTGTARAPATPRPTPIGNRLRRLRSEHGAMTQQALAEACGVARQTIIALEAGRYAPSLELAFRIARAFGVGVEDVFRWQGK